MWFIPYYYQFQNIPSPLQKTLKLQIISFTTCLCPSHLGMHCKYYSQVNIWGTCSIPWTFSTCCNVPSPSLLLLIIHSEFSILTAIIFIPCLPSVLSCSAPCSSYLCPWSFQTLLVAITASLVSYQLRFQLLLFSHCSCLVETIIWPWRNLYFQWCHCIYTIDVKNSTSLYANAKLNLKD